MLFILHKQIQKRLKKSSIPSTIPQKESLCGQVIGKGDFKQKNKKIAEGKIRHNVKGLSSPRIPNNSKFQIIAEP